MFSLFVFSEETKVVNINLGKKNIDENSKKKPIKSDLYITLYPIYHISKICGLLPVRFSAMREGLYSGKLCKIEIIYG